ncbi:TetR/AcrR family transcriptional regulator [Nocardioides marmoriginsengisoli]|uniref:TetR/AcrR family transcriptional regulator n=1 Tax=Nocardioides marmoriginsengisoli TaxID=661483 RepID=UPI00161D33A1|nr:TetR/AcrR family transcriptional regulator [Nocardioides marmoriginsengisoli]
MNAEQRPLRADAQRNLERITASAQALFAERGTAAQMEDIAAHAGVGVGTLYRRFPTKESLLTALVRGRFQEFTVIATEIEATIEDPYDALATMMRRHAETVEDDAAFQLAMMSINSFQWEGIEEDKSALNAVVLRIIERAQRAGAVRADLRIEEYGMLMCATTATMYFLHDRGVWRRHLEIVLDGLRSATA